MILESATINVKPGQEEAFEAAIRQARRVIAASPGFDGLTVQRCIETPSRYLLLVIWGTLEDHTVGFRQSARFQEWRGLLGPFFDQPPQVEHYQAPLEL